MSTSPLSRMRSLPPLSKMRSLPPLSRMRSLPPLVVDGAIAAAALAGTVGPHLVPPLPPWWVLALALLASAPLLWRSRAPVLVFAVVGPALTVLAMMRYADYFMPYGTVICAYTIAAQSSAAKRRLTAAVGSVGLLVSLAVPQEEFSTYGYAALAVVTAWALGTGTRARRDRIAMLADRARQAEERRAAAIARERVRIARDMHDVVTHSVGLMVLRAETGPLLVERDPADAVKAFEGIADTGRDAIGQLRRIVGTLRDSGVSSEAAQPGLAAIADLVERTRAAGPDATLEESGDPRPISGEAAVAAYRVVQEALGNALRHADATRIRTSLTWTSDALTVEVSDDGRGPADGVPADVGGSYGLIGMRERVTACGGTLRTGGRPGGGFDVTARLPLG